MSNLITFEEIGNMLDNTLENFKRDRMCPDSVSVKEWYDKTLQEEEKTIKEIVKDSETLDLVLVHRKSNFELRRFTWQTLNKIRLFVAIREAATTFFITNPVTIAEIDSQINDLVEEFKKYEEELYYVALEEEQVFEMIDDLFLDEEAEQIKKIMNDTCEKIVYGEAHTHIKLTPECVEDLIHGFRLITQIENAFGTEREK